MKENMRAYIIQILGETIAIEKEVLNEAIRNVLPKDKNFTFHIAEIERLDIEDKSFKGLLR